MGFHMFLFAAAGMISALAASTENVRAHPSGMRPSPEEIAQAVRGKLCTTHAGARFAFGVDGSFAYDGLWQSSGSYIVTQNSVVVTFDSGLRRSFAISKRDGSLYMEQTRVTCLVDH